MKSVNKEARVDAFIKTMILIPAGTRCCESHLDEAGLLTFDSICDIHLVENTTNLGAHEIEELILSL